METLHIDRKIHVGRKIHIDRKIHIGRKIHVGRYYWSSSMPKTFRLKVAPIDHHFLANTASYCIHTVTVTV